MGWRQHFLTSRSILVLPSDLGSQCACLLLKLSLLGPTLQPKVDQSGGDIGFFVVVGFVGGIFVVFVVCFILA